MARGAVYRNKQNLEVIDVAAAPLTDDWVRIKVGFAGICGSDMHLYHGLMDARVQDSMVIGHEASGTIVETGRGVAAFSPGDRVVVRPVVPCHSCPACDRGLFNICHNFRLLGIDIAGCFQDFWDVPAECVHKIPDQLPLRTAALIEPVAVACHAVQTIGRVETGQYVVVIGGGPIGVLVSLVAMSEGATVLLSEVAEERLEGARRLGIATINPLEEDLVGRVFGDTGDAGADLVFEVSSSQAGVSTMTQLPRVQGRMICVSMFHDPPKIDLLAFFKRELRLEGARVYLPRDFESAIAIAASSTLPLDQFISDTVPLAETARAFRELDGARDKLKVLLEVQGEDG